MSSLLTTSLRLAAVCLLLAAAVPASAELLCGELTAVADDLDDIADGFAASGTIREGDSVDRALGDIINELERIGRIENDPAFSNAVRALARAWDSFDGDGFADALERMIHRLDSLYERDC
jgi:hypothetical protein